MSDKVKWNVGAPVDFPGMLGRNPAQIFEYTNDFTEFAAGDWTITTVEDGTGSATEAVVTDGSAGPWGVLKLTNAAGADDQDNIQGPEVVKLDQPTYFRARAKLDDTGLAEWCIGLSITDTTLIATGALSSSDFIGFSGGPTASAADAMIGTAIKDSTSTDTDAITIADDTFYDLEILFDGTTAYFAVDGILKGSVTTNIPDNEYLAVSIAVNNSTAVARNMYIDRIQLIQSK